MSIHNETLLDDGQLTDYAGQIAILNDNDFVDEIAKHIYSAGFSPRMTVADQKAGIGYKEAERREKPWLYVRAYNSAARSAGVEIDRTDLEKARAPQPVAA